MMKINQIIITEHAYQRAKERLRWNKKTLDRMTVKAYNNGDHHTEVKGELGNHIENLLIASKNANKIRLHGGIAYIFAGAILITIYRIDVNFNKKQRRKIK